MPRSERVLDVTRNRPPPPGWHAGERGVIAVAWVVQTALRVLYTLHHRTDSDEPQHLHVVWGWTQGLVQYRDLFDNHAPLFHLLMAPLAAAFGERADLVVRMRWVMVPLVLIALFAFHRIARAVWGPVTAWRAVAIAGLVPGFLLDSSEFRADILWMASWFAALAVLFSGRPGARRGMLGGLLLGIALATSLKTILLLAALCLAAALTYGIGPGPGPRPGSGRLRMLLGAAAGSMMAPAAVVAFFARLGALPAMWRCTVRHNLLRHVGRWNALPLRLVLLAAALAAALVIARRLLGRPRAPFAPGRQMMVLLTTGFGYILLETIWPLVTAEDFLPLAPLAVLLGVVAVERALPTLTALAARHFRRAARALPATLAAAIVAAEVARACVRDPAWEDGTRAQADLLATVLQATRPGEPVLDLKGETVFRPRPHYYALEGLTKARLACGLLPDRIAHDVINTRTHFAVGDSKFWPPASRAFLNAHFIPAGMLRVLGCDLSHAPLAPDGARLFDVAYADSFAILADAHPGRGRLDGTAYRRPRWLMPGLHAYLPGPDEFLIIAVWLGACEREPIRSALAGATATFPRFARPSPDFQLGRTP